MMRNRGIFDLLASIMPMLVAAAGYGQEMRDRELPGVVSSPQSSLIDPQYLPPGIRPPGTFKLGIMARNTQTGVQLTQVLPNSVAQRAGLEAGDTIVNVEGYQVGYVSGRLYDLGDELSRRVDSLGRVTLLVRNHRDGRLVNVAVQFIAETRTVSGNVHAKGTNSLGRTAVLTVRLLDVTRPHWRDVTVAEVNLDVPRRWPAPYRLNVDPSSLRAGHRYAVDARVTDRGQMVWQTAGPTRIAMSESGDRVDLTLVSAGSRPGAGIVPYEQISQWYERYLGRRPSDREMSAWQADLDRGHSLEDVEATILSSSEFFDRQQNDPDRYVDEVYRQLNGTTPTPQQHQSLREQLQRQGEVRHRFMQDLLQRRSGSEAPSGNR